MRDIDAFYDMKLRGVAYRKPDRYHDIYMPRSTGAGVILGGLAFVLGFAIVWHIWWMAIACGVGLWAIIIARVYQDDSEFRLPASEVEKIEQQRYQALAKAPRARTADDRLLSTAPLPEGLT